MTAARSAETVTAQPNADVVCLGESMVTFVPSHPGRLADVPAYERGIGGAESNVACCLARAGHATRWVSRVGADGFGEHLVAAIAAHGVDTSAVRRDPHRPTGIYFRTAGERATTTDGTADGSADGTTDSATGGRDPRREHAEVVYYRAGSAASVMSPGLMDCRALWSTRILHVTGITAALSGSCLELTRMLTTRIPARPLVSFDVNYRVGLWRDQGEVQGRDRGESAGPAVLLDLARGSDIVFVGEDEAEAAWNLRGPEAVRDALPEPGILVVKEGGHGATAYARQADGTDTITFEPALDVDVVAHVGAGDAFAAGFLSGTLRGLPTAARLRHGHLMAAAALTVPGDLGVPPARSHADRLAALDPAQWETLRLGPGWTTGDTASDTNGDPADDGAGTERVEVRTS
ncbi:sugar kinase [Streptomyces sp. 7N604]|uniref:sugar kinase n=1 Tax=Streptomyces sp. 7N604 TaxID=3457415 RepID=UPI003FD1DE24